MVLVGVSFFSADSILLIDEEPSSISGRDLPRVFSRRLKEIEGTQIYADLIFLIDEQPSSISGKYLPRVFSRRCKEIEDTQIYADSMLIINRQSYPTGKSNNGF